MPSYRSIVIFHGNRANKNVGLFRHFNLRPLIRKAEPNCLVDQTETRQIIGLIKCQPCQILCQCFLEISGTMTRLLAAVLRYKSYFCRILSTAI